MNKSGKTLTIFLVVIAILLLSLTVISIFFYKNESDLRKTAETKLAQLKTLEVKLEGDLKDAKKQVFLLEEKEKEADAKINELLDEIELVKGVKDQMKSENTSLKEALTKESQEKEALQTELASTQEKISALEEKAKNEENARLELEGKVKESELAEVQLDKIVVTPGEIPSGQVVSVDLENNFLIINLGQEHGVTPDLVMSVFRGDKYLGDIKVTRVQAGMSVADFITPFTVKQVKKDDRVAVKK